MVYVRYFYLESNGADLYLNEMNRQSNSCLTR